MKVVIIGGVAGGATAAARLRRLDENAEIVVFERTGFVSYANCGLPYYIGGVIEDKRELSLQTPESFRRRFAIDVRVRSEVVAIDTEKKQVTVNNLADGSSYVESYDKLILSPGAKAMKPDMPGIDSDKIFSLRTVEDTYRIKEYVDATKPKTAVVIGGGFIGLEMAENLVHLGVETILLQRSQQVMPPLDYDMACHLHSFVRENGIDLRLNQPFTGFTEDGDKIQVVLKSGEPVEADMVILAIGVVPDSNLAKETGLALGEKGSILVNEKMETSAADIYAVGDAVEVVNFVTGNKALIPLAGPANKQGRIVANNICGKESEYPGSQGSSILKIFDMTVATTGINEKQAKAANIEYDKTVVNLASHATYYPGARNMVFKVLFRPSDGLILGGQIVGFEGVDKRIDVLATAIRAKMTAADLEELDLAYAPPYSSAKDPVNMSGFVIENIRNGVVKQFYWDDVDRLTQDENAVVLDVRTKGEVAYGPIPNAVHIPVDQFRENLDNEADGQLPKDKPVYVLCHSGLRSYIACRILSQNGYDCYNLSGGYAFYSAVVKGSVDTDPTYNCGIKIGK